ncbi:MAG: hypothetical protein ABIH00_06545, partial [Armatimonadota bacterium]
MGLYDRLKDSVNSVKITKSSSAKQKMTFNIIDERNFDKYINSGMGTKFLSSLKKKDFTLWKIIVDNQRKLKYLPKKEAEYLSKKKEALFRLFNEFHIKNSSYIMYANQHNMNKILCSSIGKDYLKALQSSGYSTLYGEYKEYGFRKMPKDQVLFVHLFNEFVKQFRNTGKKEIKPRNTEVVEIRKRVKVAKSHYTAPKKPPIDIAKNKDLFHHPVKPLIKVNEFTVFNHSFIDKGLLRFVNKNHADSFFVNLKLRCSQEKLLSMYSNLKNERFNGRREDNLFVNLNNMEVSNYGDKVKRFKKIVFYLHKHTMPDNVVLFPYLKNTAFKNWPKAERVRFINFCKENFTEGEYISFARQVKNLKINLPAWDNVKLWWAELNFMNPGKLAAQIRRIGKVGPSVNDAKGLARWISPYRKDIAQGRLKEIYVYLDNVKDSDGALIPRLALVPNNTAEITNFNLLKGRHFVYSMFHKMYSPQAVGKFCEKLDRWNVIEHGFSYLDMAILPSLAKVNNELGRNTLLEMYGMFMFFRQLYNPITWARFIAGLSQIDKDITEAVHIWNHGTSVERALLTGTVMGLIFGPKAFGKINKLAFTKAIIFENGRFRVVSRSSIPSGEGIKASIMDVIERHSNGNPKKVRVVTQRGSVWEAEYGIELGEDGFPVSMSAKKVGKAPRAQRPSVKVTEGKAEPVKLKPKILPPKAAAPDPAVVDTVVGGMDSKLKPSHALVKAARKAVAKPQTPKPALNRPESGKLAPKSVMEIMQDAAKALFPPQLALEAASAGAGIPAVKMSEAVKGTDNLLMSEGTPSDIPPEDGDLQLTAQLVSRFHTTDSLPEKISIIDVARSNRLYLLAGEFSYLL